MTTIESLDDTLASFGIDAGYAEKRRKRAGELLSAGWSDDDLSFLGNHVESTTDSPTQAIRVLADLLNKPEKARARLDDARRHSRDYEARRGSATRPVYPGEALWRRPDAESGPWTRIDQRVRVAVLIRREGRTHEEVAATLGIPIEDVHSLLDEHDAELKSIPPEDEPPAAQDEDPFAGVLRIAKDFEASGRKVPNSVIDRARHLVREHGSPSKTSDWPESLRAILAKPVDRISAS